MPSTTHHDASSAMPFGSVKYTERMNSWSTTSVTSEPAASSRLRSISSACSSGTSNEMWSSWMARSLGPPAGLANVSAPSTSKNATVLPRSISKK